MKGREIDMGEKRGRVELLERNIQKGSYCLDKDIDEYTLEFTHPSGRDYNSEYVDEYELPKNYEYIVTTNTEDGKNFPSWVSIANPEGLRDVIDKDDECLPDLHFIFKGE